MGLCQHDFTIYPQSKLKEHYGEIPKTIDDEEADRDWWQGVPIPTDEEFENILPFSDQQWSKEIRIWGDDRSDRIWLLINEDGSTDGIQIRVDLSKEYPEVRRFIESLIKLAQKHELVFKNESGDCFMPNYEQLAIDLKLSDAQRFINDPEEYLKEKRS